MKKTIQGIYQSLLFEDPQIIHGFSTKQFGDLRNAKDQQVFLSTLGADVTALVYQEQIHSDVIHIVQPSDRGTTIKGVDGLIFKQESVSSPVILSVHTADCMPILFFDPVARSIGAAHSGWRGTALHIGRKMIQEMKTLGSNPSDIRIAIGPSICGSCYGVGENVVTAFKKEFAGCIGIVNQANGKTYVDIARASICDFFAEGILESHIDRDASLCTFEKTDEFYSYRRTGKPLPGEIIGVIGFR